MSSRSITLREFVNRVQDDARCFLMEWEKAIAKHPLMFKGSAPRSYWIRVFLQFMRDGEQSISDAVPASEFEEQPTRRKRQP